MATVLLDVFVIAGIMLAANLASYVVDRTWHPTKRRVHNDLIAWQISTMGTIYAVIIGFMLLTVWTKFDAAQANAEMEADSLVQINRIASHFEPAQRDAIQQTDQQYVNVMLSREWPAMENGQLSPESDALMQRLNGQILAIQPSSTAQGVLLDHAISELSKMADCRRLRQVQSRAQIPTILWLILILGGAVTILVSCLLGTENKALHVLLISALSFVIGLCLVGIADINHPFRGATHVPPTGFLRASQTLHYESGR
jgi:hypothetical protein